MLFSAISLGVLSINSDIFSSIIISGILSLLVVNVKFAPFLKVLLQ